MKVFLLNWLFWPILMISWELVSKKRSHWWHWNEYQGEIDLEMCVRVDGDSKAKPRSSRWSMLWQTNFGWKLTAVVTPEVKGPFRIGFVTESGRKELCSVLVNKRYKRAALFLGPDPSVFFALDKNGKQIPLRFVKKAHKSWLPRKTIVL